MSTDTLRAESISPAEPMPGGESESVRFGSFAVTGTLPSLEGESKFSVVGAEGTPFAGSAVIVTTLPAPTSPDDSARNEVLLVKLRHCTHSALVPVLEVGSTGSETYWVHAMPEGQPLVAESTEPMPITMVVAWVNRLSGALQIAHDLGLSHGAISRETISRVGTDQPVLAGLGIAGAGASADQRQLAIVAAELLAGRAWVAPHATAELDSNYGRALRGFLAEYTERVANVLIRATKLDASEQFGSISEFARQFDSAVRLSAEDLVFGAYEAISAKSPDLARVIADKAATYDPSCEGLTLLNLQLRGASPFSNAQPQPVLDNELPLLNVEPNVPAANLPGLPIDTADLADIARSNLPEELTRGLPDEFLRAIAPQFTVTPPKSRVNPVFVLVLGAVGILVLLAAAGLGTILLSGR